MARVKIDFKPEAPPERSVKFVSSGSVLLDLVLGGGWAQGRIANIVGDSSSGKTLLAIEAMINFSKITDLDHIHYQEAEAAFDEDYAASLGLPQGISRDDEVRTVEDWERELIRWLDKLSGKQPSLYVLDSLDALSDEAEQKRDIGEGSYGAAKAKKISELFRKHVSEVEAKNCTLMIISQLRDKIGVTFGETKMRSGGRALRFYASQELWIAEIQKLKKTISHVERVYGVAISAKTKKNKVGPPFRSADMTIQFNYGVDDELSMIDWLGKHKVIEPAEKGQYTKQLHALRQARDRTELNEMRILLRDLVQERWQGIEEALLPSMTKYGD